MKKFIDLLEKELGYSEKADAYTKFGDWYGKNIEFDADYSSAPWCDMYLSWAAAKLGYEDWVGQFAWTVAHAEWFQEQGAWGKTPKPGAFVFYDWRGGNDVDGIDHVGIVTRVEGDTIYTIEGNIDGGVAKRKERDTSKVVGYGYPEKIKARLDKEAARKRDEKEVKASTGHPSDGDGLPDQGLTALIPQTAPEQAHAPLSAPSPQKTAESPAAPKSGANRPTEERPEAARPGVASTVPEAGKAIKKGKHAKPATADTNAATTAPLPVIVDSKPADTTTALGTPAFIGSALIAALAVLAVTKTRQLRVRPAAATPAKPAPKRGRRRRPRRGQIALQATSEVTLTTEATSVAERPLDLTLAGLETAPAKLELPLRTGAVLDRPIDTISAQMAATANTLDTQPPTVDTRQPAVDTGQPAVDTSHYVFSEDTGALPRIFDKPEPGLDLDRLTAKALENLDAATARAVEPFDPFTPRTSAPKKTGSYHGRRRRPAFPTELDTAFAQNAQYAPARGRRHRASARATFVGDILDTPEAFTQEAPLRGRRHRRTEASRHVNA
ncbi:CHAP domain-containing protein [Nonomuraea sp. NPDC050540]|uniref:CHAP domain-containing protein n=1 Tax=Nonomuraea sp. NPDC050540 TaxID=3364367 RepID=UPI0037AA8883